MTGSGQRGGFGLLCVVSRGGVSGTAHAHDLQFEDADLKEIAGH